MTTERRITGRHEDPKTAHHLWAADEDDKGVHVRRNRQEPEMFSGEQSRTASLSQRVAFEKCAACLGLMGADLVDNPTYVSDLPAGVVKRFNEASRDEVAPRIHTWEELRRAFGDEAITHARKAFGQGIQTRLASKEWGIPFMMAADILDKLPKVSREEVGKAVAYVKTTPIMQRVASSMDFVTRRVAMVFDAYDTARSRRIAIDEKAVAYWESYYGPFGRELVRDVHKRVRADLAGAWLRKQGVDEAAAEYWRSYFGEYGDKWVTVVPKKLSPTNARP